MEGIVSWGKKSTVLNAGILHLSILWWLNSSGDGEGDIFSSAIWFLVFEKKKHFVELLDAQWGYVVDFLFKQGKAACNFISFLCFIKTTRFNKKRVQKEENQNPQKTELLQRKESKSWSSKLGAEQVEDRR